MASDPFHDYVRAFHIKSFWSSELQECNTTKKFMQNYEVIKFLSKDDSIVSLLNFMIFCNDVCKYPKVSKLKVWKTFGEYCANMLEKIRTPSSEEN